MIGHVGLTPERYWSYTLRENVLLAQSYGKRNEELWMMTRNIEFANYNTTFNSMNGKQIFKTIKKPQDLYKLPSEDKIKETKQKTSAVYDPERALAAFNRLNDRQNGK